MHYIKFIMKNIVFSLIKYLYYFSFTAMIILYLFPGSLIGFLLYEDFARQPDLIANPIELPSITYWLFYTCLY